MVLLAAPHPLDPSTAEELSAAVSLIKGLYSPDVLLHFKVAGLQEPPKKTLLAYLAAEKAGQQPAPLPRLVSAMYYIKSTPRLFEVTLDVTNMSVVHHLELPRSCHAPVDRLELNEAARVAVASDEVKAELKRLEIGDVSVEADPWDYGRDDEDEDRRLTQIFFYTRNPANNHPDSNHYAFPLDFMALVDLVEMKVVKIAYIPLGVEPTTTAHTGPRKLGKPLEPEYAHHLQSNPARTTVKPLQVVQPEGASFQVQGQLVNWEGWSFRVGFNWREGMVLHDLSFQGQSNFHRLSLSEMYVPYGDPRDPLHRKGAFDLGNVGAGTTANNLTLGCDCLGLIHYFGGNLIDARGEVVSKPSAICMHEVDAALQWKHTNHRTGRATVVRKRQLVLQTVITVANYEYIFNWVLDQSGEIEFETRATGILSTTPIDPDNTEKVPFGTRVASGVLAPYHQHIFNLRIDPAIQGHSNSLVVSESVALEVDENLNKFGTGYITTDRTVKVSGTEETNPFTARTFKIVNPNVINPVSLLPVGYKLVPISSQPLLAHPSSWHAKRAEFCQHPIWVTKYKDGELFPAGTYTNQSRGGHGIGSWVAREDNVEDEDIVIWHSYTFQHIPRPEDFPIMPAESVRIALKPNSFCNYNPTMDVPESQQLINKSVLYDPSLQVGASSQDVNGQTQSCCK